MTHWLSYSTHSPASFLNATADDMPAKTEKSKVVHSGEILNKLKPRGFLASGLSTYDFSTLYTTLPQKT